MRCPVLEGSTTAAASAAAGVWNYGLNVTGGYDGFCYLPDTTSISFTGMTGVTGASATGTLGDFYPSNDIAFTSTSATYTGDPYLSTSETNGTLTIDSTSPAGTITYEITGLYDPSVAGPTGATAAAEPGSLAMLLGGIVALGLLMGLAPKKLRESGSQVTA